MTSGTEANHKHAYLLYVKYLFVSQELKNWRRYETLSVYPKNWAYKNQLIYDIHVCVYRVHKFPKNLGPSSKFWRQKNDTKPAPY